MANKSKRKSEFNYRETLVPDYDLPATLVAGDGSAIRSTEQWETTRRPELMQLFREEVYGLRPATQPRVRYETLERQTVFDGKATGLQVKALIEHQGKEHAFEFTVFIPNQDNPAPLLVHINNRYLISLQSAIQKEDPFWPARMIVKRGYATASFHTSDVDPDQADGYEKGVRCLLDDPDSDLSTRWRSLSAWGWGASRVLDFAAELKSIDPTRAAVIGHSRGGKAALWAAAEDPRFTLAYSNNSGCGGAALSRRRFGETVGRITSVFPHWFTDRFANYAGREDQLPIDQHQLISLIAPRSVYVASADQDLWADPRGEYLALIGAADVFELYGETSISQTTMPPLGEPRHIGATGYHIRGGKHNLTELDWKHFLDFAATRF
ncbi:MAG: acetylxylan esterase [Planctomycetota bacterium]